MVKKIIRFILAGLAAFVLLNIFCLMYYKLPVHITTKTGVTDYVWESRAYYSKMTEGFGYGKMNNEGFNNLEDYNAQPVDILIFGSSQMEGTNVPQRLTTAALLNRRFNESKYVYNIGISSHGFARIVQNFENALRFYKLREYAIIEINGIEVGMQEMEESLNGTLQRLSSYDTPIMFVLQKIPYLRLLYSQYVNFTRRNDDDIPSQNNIEIDTETLTVLDAVMKKIYRVSMEHGIQPLIFHHPHFIFNEDGSIKDNTDMTYLAAFETACRNNNIAFVNMRDVFVEAYNREHILPHGFSNTAVGAGHLNKNGHRLIAGELFRRINLIENDGTI